jgi:hypothetical protein
MWHGSHVMYKLSITPLLRMARNVVYLPRLGPFTMTFACFIH